MQWDLQSIRLGIISLYGKSFVSSIRKSGTGKYYFRYDSRVNFEDLGKHMGVMHSGPSISSDSSDRPKGKWWRYYEKA